MDEVTKSKVMEICKSYNVLFNQFSESKRAKSDEVDAKTIISYYLFKTAKMKQREIARWLRISRSLVATNIKRFEDMFEFDKEFREMCDSLNIFPKQICDCGKPCKIPLCFDCFKKGIE